MKAWIALPAVILLWGCSDADTLGEEPPREIVIQGAPTWTNQIAALAELKCAYCHAYPLPPLAPNDAPQDLDLTRFETYIAADGRVIRGADAVGSWIVQGLLEQPVAVFADFSNPSQTLEARQMPLDYGTQLTAQEIINLELWSEEGSPRDEAPEPAGDAVAGRPLYFNCDFCHGFDGSGLSTQDGRFFGPPLRPKSVTISKIKSMWLHRSQAPEPLSDESAANLRAYILQLVGESP